MTDSQRKDGARRLHVESMYGFYHGQDPRCFDPDEESCTEQEIANHKAAVDAANRGEWIPDDSGCHVAAKPDSEVVSVLCTSSMGIGVYEIVMDDEGNFIRDATYADLEREDSWEEAI